MSTMDLEFSPRQYEAVKTIAAERGPDCTLRAATIIYLMQRDEAAYRATVVSERMSYDDFSLIMVAVAGQISGAIEAGKADERERWVGLSDRLIGLRRLAFI